MKDEFKALPAHIRGPALVGLFLQFWALLESGMNRAIGKALGLTVLQEAFVTANLQFRDKINILLSALQFTTISPSFRLSNTSTYWKGGILSQNAAQTWPCKLGH